MEPEGSLPYSQEPATCPYPEPAQSSPYNATYPHRRKCEADIKVDLQEVGIGSYEVDRSGSRWRAFANAVTKFRIP